MVRCHEVEATVCEVEIVDVDQAVGLRFFGSPTIQVNGEDIDPAMKSRTDYSFSCRMYDGSGVPPRALLVRALQEASRAGGKGVAA